MSIVRVASFDIGKKNFCFYIEEFSQTELESIQNITCVSDRYNHDGTPTDKMKVILDTLYKNGKTIIYKNSDLTHGTSDNKYLDPIVFYNMTSLLDKYIQLWDSCGAFIIEQQMSFGRNKINTMALKLGQHCFSYFAIRYGRFGKQIIEFPAYHKTTVLGAPKLQYTTKKGKLRYKNMDKPRRKKWSVKHATYVLCSRNEEHVLLESSLGKKKDDLADCVCQLQAFKYLFFINKSIKCI